MKKVFRKYNTDASKLDPRMKHDFYPIEGDDTVYLEVEYLKNGDMLNFMELDSKEINYAKMFQRKVKAVHGVEIEGAEGKTIEATVSDIVNISDPDFLLIVMNTCMHLINGMNLTEEEAKN